MAKFYTVSTFKNDVNFDSYKDAEKFFNKIKMDFTYCEFKAVEISAQGYRSESIATYHK